jgi:hypothetical protein
MAEPPQRDDPKTDHACLDAGRQTRVGGPALMLCLCAAFLAVPALLLAAAATGAASSRHKPGRQCQSRHAHLIAADAVAQVYETYEAGQLTVFGCAYGHRSVYNLGAVASCGGGGGSCGGISRETLAGPIVAFAEGSSAGALSLGGGAAHEFVVVCDLRSGRAVHRVPTGPSPSHEGIGPAEAIVLKGDGAVAWIVQTSPEEGTYQVQALDRSGTRKLASGADIDPHSLALAGSTLYWIQAGKPISAPLN